MFILFSPDNTSNIYALSYIEIRCIARLLNGFRIYAHPAKPQSVWDNCQAKRNMVGEALSETRAAGIAVE
jgi:hypothetical protein